MITQDPGTDKSAPFVELSISDNDDYGWSSEITIRKYPRRVFVAYFQDDSQYQIGDDNMDVFVSPSYITEKTLHVDFDLHRSLVYVCKKLYGEHSEMADYLFEQYHQAWNYIMQNNIEAARKSLPEEEYER